MASPLIHFFTKPSFNNYAATHNKCCTELMTLRVYFCFGLKVTMSLYLLDTERCATV